MDHLHLWIRSQHSRVSSAHSGASKTVWFFRGGERCANQDVRDTRENGAKSSDDKTDQVLYCVPSPIGAIRGDACTYKELRLMQKHFGILDLPKQDQTLPKTANAYAIRGSNGCYYDDWIGTLKLSTNAGFAIGSPGTPHDVSASDQIRASWINAAKVYRTTLITFYTK